MGASREGDEHYAAVGGRSDWKRSVVSRFEILSHLHGANCDGNPRSSRYATSPIRQVASLQRINEPAGGSLARQLLTQLRHRRVGFAVMQLPGDEVTKSQIARRTPIPSFGIV